MLKFFIALIFAAALLLMLLYVGVANGYFPLPSFFKPTIVLLTISTGIIYVYLYKAGKPEFFLQLYLLTMVVKLLAYCSYCLIMILKDNPAGLENIVFFLLTYFVFTALEIGFLYRKIMAGNKP